MDLRQIAAFIAVYEFGSINRASQRLGLAQPSVSAIIRNLETELAAPLFDRQARGTRPTPAADTFYRHCQKILAEVDMARKAVAGGPDRIAGPVSVGLAPTATKGLMPNFLAGFLDDYPDVELQIAEAFSGPLTEWTLSGQVDLAIVAVPPMDRRLVTRQIASEPIVLVSAPGRARTKSHKLVLPAPRNGLRTVIDGYIRQTSLQVTRTVELDSLQGMLEFVMRSDWVTLLSVTAILSELERGEIAVHPTDPPIELGFYLIHPARRALSTAAARFVERLEAGFAASRSDWSRRAGKIRRERRGAPAS